jgi:hypothetical protein
VHFSSEKERKHKIFLTVVSILPTAIHTKQIPQMDYGDGFEFGDIAGATVDRWMGSGSSWAMTDAEEKECDDFEELSDLRGQALLNQIALCLSHLKDGVRDRKDGEGLAHNIDIAEDILKAVQRYCSKKSLRPSPGENPVAPTRTIGDLYQYILPKMKGPKKALKRLHKLAKETVDVVLTAEASVLSHVIKHPDSLRSLRSFEGGAPHLAKIKPLFAGNAKERSGKTDRKITNDDIGENDDNAIGVDVKREKERVEVVNEKIKDMV